MKVDTMLQRALKKLESMKDREVYLNLISEIKKAIPALRSPE